MLFRTARRDKQIHVVVSPDLAIRSDASHAALSAMHARLAPLSQRALKPLERIRFSFHTHKRACIALASATLLAGGAMVLVTGGLVRHGHAAQPVLVDPIKLVHSHAAMKEARLLPQNDVDENRRIAKRIDIAEGTDDGEATLFTYQHVILDLANERNSQALISHDPSPDRHQGGNGFNHDTEISELANQKGVPLNVSFARPASTTHQTVHEIVLAPQSREKVGVLMQAADVAAEDSANLEQALGRKNLVPGDNLILLLDQSPNKPAHITMARFRHGSASDSVYGRTDNGVFRANDNQRLFARLSHDAMLSASRQPSKIRTDGSVQSRLIAAGAPRAVADDVKKLASENNVSLQQGANGVDKIDLLFRESVDTDPELVFVEFTSNGESKRLYRHEVEGNADYFNEDGSSMTKYLMHKPLPNGRLNDGFGWRVHPVLHVRKHHNGVDYDAPSGSPIVAAGDGTVELISSQKGYGKYVRIRHQGGYSTTYAHLSAEAKGLKVGQHVKQGEVIAYVGSTGYSTGPHLYYELKVGDHYVDPLKAQLNAGEKLTGSSMSSFRSEMDHVDKVFKQMNSAPMATDARGGMSHVGEHHGR
ncbi:M23 family metallopeptidase [Brucella grignonensis]|uniref:Peptidase M23 family protein n=1 Tax=Brucella grignonensis TaxID=94627 RepID=A0A256F226_9HYPH|nr:M23 family metallopeptidase [Brucella grignonensis]OYR08897.1 peptidase M23 family protein [Brucella grignonensis]